MTRRKDRRGRRVVGAAVAAAALAAARPAAAQEPVAAGEKASGREHVVRRGETLWGLAALYLNNPFLWGLIYEANRGVVEDPHWIFPAERLVIPGVAPVAAAGDSVAADSVAAVEAAEPAPAEAPARTRFYSGLKAAPEPAEAEPREAEPATGAAPERPVPQVARGEFYAAPWLGSPADLPVAGELVAPVGSEGGSVLAETVHPREAIYLRYRGRSRPAVGDRFLLFHPGRSVAGWGRVISPAAIARVTALDEETMTAVVVEQFGTLETGALAIPLEEYPGPVDAAPEPVEDGPQGEIIAFEQPQPLPSPRDRAFIDLGREDGVEVGDELVAVLPSRGVRGAGVELPAERVARLRVVRVAERSATVQVLDLKQAALRPGLPVRLIAKRR